MAERPILPVLLDRAKKEKFADLAQKNNRSMSWLVNQAIDKMLEADSIDIYKVHNDYINRADLAASAPSAEYIQAIRESYIKEREQATIPSTIPEEIRSIIAKEIDRIEDDLDEQIGFIKTDLVNRGVFDLFVGELEETLNALNAKLETDEDDEGGMMTQRDWWIEKFDDLRGQLRMVIEDFDHRLRELEFKVPIAPPAQATLPAAKKKGFG